MKLIFVRHGDPDYEHDCLTETGELEGRLLNERIKTMSIDECYASTMGRARRTAELGLMGTGLVPTECDWMREFHAPVKRPDLNGEMSWVCWDWLPSDWTCHEEFFDPKRWSDQSIMAEANVRKEYDRVCGKLDELIAEHGYERCGKLYRAVNPNNKTLVIFCHYGVTCVFLSHLINVSPMVLWQGISMAPTSLTTVVTEERRPGIAYFRASSIGDTSHLYAGGREPSFSARFCECYANAEERHD